MSKIMPCLWFKNEAEDAAHYYVSLLPESKIVHVQHSPVDYPGGPQGAVLVVYFMLAGQDFMALNGGSVNEYNNCVSFTIDCQDQEEVDRLWNRILADGGKEIQCGWIHDKFGVPWQIIPADLPRLLADHDKAKSARVMLAMMDMIKIDIAALHKAYAGE